MPIPRSIPFLGQWIGLVSDVYGKVRLVDMPLIYCRVSEAEKKSFESETRLSSANIRVLVAKLYKRIILGN